MSVAEAQLSQPAPPPDTSVPAARRAWRRLALRVGVSGLTVVVLIILLPREELWVALRRVSLLAWAGCVAIYLCLHLLGVLKWRLTVNLMGAGLNLVQAGRCYYGGLFGNLFLPSILGGDFVRAGLAFGRARSRPGLVLAILGALFLPERLAWVGQKVLVPVGAGLVAGGACLAALWFWLPVQRFRFKTRRLLVKLRKASRSALQRPHFLLASLVLGVTLQGSLVCLNAVLGRACGLECSLAVWFFVWPLAKLSAVLPITQGGIGVREAALAALFATFDVPAALAVAAGLVFEGVVLTGGFAGGIIAVGLGPRSQCRALRTTRAWRSVRAK
jgi:hypothetical protein